jgi:hypothetical protein
MADFKKLLRRVSPDDTDYGLHGLRVEEEEHIINDPVGTILHSMMATTASPHNHGQQGQ